MLGFHFLHSGLDQGEYVLEGTYHFLKEFYPPTFHLEQANDTPSQEIIFETLHPKKMVMSGPKPMTLLLSQIVAYPPLGKYHEHKLREIYLTIDDISCPTTQYKL